MRRLILSLVVLALTMVSPYTTSAQSVEVHFNQGIDYFDSGQYQKAIYSFTKAIEMKPGYADTWVRYHWSA